MSTPMTTTVQDGLIDTAKRVLPGGTFGNMTGDVVIREGRGGRVWDENGKEYVDFLLGSGPMLVGHAHPEVTAAAQARVAQGTTFFANNRSGSSSPRRSSTAVPCAEQVRFVSTGLGGRPLRDARRPRLHRARQDPQVRGRLSRDERLFADEPGAEALRPISRGRCRIPPASRAALRDEMLIAPFNDIEAVAGIVREHRDELAGGHRRTVPAHHPAGPGLSRRRCASSRGKRRAR